VTLLHARGQGEPPSTSSERVAAVAHSDEARPAVERVSAEMPKLTVSTPSLEMRLECPKCESSLPASKIKQHCFEKHGYTDSLWRKFVQRQTSQTVVDLLENRPSPKGSSIKRKAKSIYKLFSKHRQPAPRGVVRRPHSKARGRPGLDSRPRPGRRDSAHPVKQRYLRQCLRVRRIFLNSVTKR
jgi:hypothetical protein